MVLLTKNSVYTPNGLSWAGLFSTSFGLQAKPQSLPLKCLILLKGYPEFELTILCENYTRTSLSESLEIISIGSFTQIPTGNSFVLQPKQTIECLGLSWSICLPCQWFRRIGFSWYLYKCTDNPFIKYLRQCHLHRTVGHRSVPSTPVPPWWQKPSQPWSLLWSSL